MLTIPPAASILKFKMTVLNGVPRITFLSSYE